MVFLGGVGLEFCDGRTPFGLRRGTDAGMGSSRPRDRMLRVPTVMRGRTLAVAACFCSPLPADTTSRPVQVPLVVIAVILRNLSMSIEQHRQALGLHAKPGYAENAVIIIRVMAQRIRIIVTVSVHLAYRAVQCGKRPSLSRRRVLC